MLTTMLLTGDARAADGWIATSPCRLATEREAARGAVASFGKLLDEPEAWPKKTLAAWRALLDQPCLRLAAKQLSMRVPHSKEQLATWWREGGEAFLRDYPSIAARWREGKRSEAVVPVEPRRLLERTLLPPGSSAARHEIAKQLLCEPVAQACDPDAADTVLTFESAARTDDRLREQACGGGPKICVPHTSDPSRRDRFRRYLTCMGQEAGPRAGRFPIGGLRLPRAGWLVLQGRRGHYQFCDELRAYDLETGAAFVASACGGLVLETGGKVNGGATAAGLRAEYKVGRVSPDAMRRVTFLLATKSLVKTELVDNASIELPADLTPIWWEREGFGEMGGMRLCSRFSSAQTHIGWAWRDADRLLASGSLTWPNSSEPVDDEVDQRLRLAEAAMIEGCAPRALPAGLLDGAPPGGVSSIDRPAEGRSEVERTLLEAWNALRQASPCTATTLPPRGGAAASH